MNGLFFHFAGGGFCLERASYTVHVDAKPALPSDSQIKQRLIAAELDPTPERVEAYRVVAMTHLPLAMAAWEACSFKVLATVGSDRIELRYTEAVRFLRQMGVLRLCQACGGEKYMPDLDIDICSDCGYLALDAGAPTVSALIMQSVGGK